MSKLRQKPTFSFEQLTFEVDTDRQLLRQVNDSSHEISFISQMADKGDHYLLAFDLDSKRVAEGDHAGKKIEPVIIPPLTALDPQGMAEKYGIAVEQLSGKTDFEVIVDQQALQQREQGVLPQIDIAGERFVIDIRLEELRHAQHFFPVISLKSFELTDDGWNYTAFYEPVMKQVVDVDPKLTELPDGVIQIKIPNEIGLDPLGTARKYGMSERELLRRYPIQKELKAEIIPLSETRLPRLIRQNREELQRQHAENMQKAKPRQRPRF